MSNTSFLDRELKNEGGVAEPLECGVIAKA